MNSLHHYAKKTSVKTSAAAFAAKGASDSPRLGGEMLCLFALVALALALRLPNLNESFWYDEIWSTSVMLGSFRSTVYTIIHDVHPPLYHLIMWLWGQLFGDSEVSVRMLPLLAGLASIPLTHLVVRERCGPVAGLIAAGLVTLSPTHIWYSQEARSYAL
ncbi:MAG: glycosyltransferase family 39 protein, partial [SAR324 cluster bacterium]|nr:glycosyltransferase family 39 protein [SAR324 cluster bacterium]